MSDKTEHPLIQLLSFYYDNWEPDDDANSLFFQQRYGLAVDVDEPRSAVLRDVSIESAELVLTWVKPQLAIRAAIPPTIKMQSWFVDHKSFTLFNETDGATTLPYVGGSTVIDIQNLNIHQIPTYMIMYATVDKDAEEYACNAVNTDDDGAAGNQVISIDLNSMESNLIPDDDGIDIRINVLGGDTLLDKNYNLDELFRFTAKNCHTDFPWDKNKFIGKEENDIPNKYASYPSTFFVVLGEDDLNSYFVRKGQTVRDVVFTIKTRMLNADGYGIALDNTDFGADGGQKTYKFHIEFVYDRYYYTLDNCGNVYTKLDAKFL